MSKFIFGVITKVPPEDDLDGGNFASAMPLYFRTREEKIVSSVTFFGVGAMSVLAPVFTLGEILVLNESGREIAGHGRKPSKWSVTCEHFSDLNDAIKRAKEVSDPDL